MPRDERILTAFRLTKTQKELLRKLARKLDTTQTDVIGMALYDLARKLYPKGW